MQINKKEDETMKKIEEFVAPFKSEIQNSLLMHSYMNVFISKGIDNAFDGSESLKENIHTLVDDLPFDKLLSILPLIVNMSNNPGASIEKGKELRNNEAYQKGYQEGLEDNRAYTKGIKEGEQLKSKEKKKLYEEAYKEGYEKGKSLRIKELKEMREWE
ncbi:hypothetical protein P4T70_26440 [Bacillus mobilis]|uniref:hypothetical protein n=1 Tax=Bacillus mobilis TaxID=2026190 RepID=UPI002E1E9ACD|nr:hypothetical protein [Bacillus mobilis]